MQAPVAGNIYGILEGSKQYVIPVYQRIYSWGQIQCDRLWIDIVEMHNRNKSGHFIGTIVNVAERPVAVGIQEFMIIDGQQRLTTLSILLLALRDYAKENSNCGINSEEINESYLINKFKSGDDKYKLLLTQSDKDIFIKKIEDSPIPETTKSRVLDNYTFFKGKIAKEEISPVELYEAIGKLQLVSITLERGYDDPQAIFESLNSTGMDLKDSDLIRNHLLMGLDSATQSDIYNNIWRPTELLFNYEQQSELLDNFFRDYLTMKLGRIPRKDDVYREFKSYQASADFDICTLCHDIYKFAKYYSDMYFARSDNAILKCLYEDMKAIRMEVSYPFLLKVHDDYAKGVITLEVMQEILQLCVSYILRRAVCNMPTNSLNKTFATMKNEVNPNDYINSLKAFFIQLDSYKEFPSNERFLATFQTRDIYNMNRCRYILGRLENWDNKSSVILDNLTIEHIIPQTPNLSLDWIRALGSNWSEIQKQYLHTIGNLTLTAYNSEMSDSPFTDKLDMPGGFKESALRLNRDVVIQDEWGEQQVVERAERLGKLAEAVWPYPTLSEEELAPYLKVEEAAPQYTLDSYSYINAFNRMLFEKLNIRILNLGTFVRREFKKLYVAYKADTNFVDVIVQKSGLRLSMNMKFDDVIDPKGICRDITNRGRWGNGDVEIYFDSLDMLEDAMEIIEQALKLQDVE